MVIPVSASHVIDNIMTTAYITNPVTIAKSLNEIYENKNLYNSLSEKSVSKFTSEIYSWGCIADQWDRLFKETLA
jgi:glycosyltransferase involved in cell wall biosynthesis